MLGGVEAVLDLDGMRRDLEDLREQAADPELWTDQERAQQVSRIGHRSGLIGLHLDEYAPPLTIRVGNAREGVLDQQESHRALV